MLSLAEIKAHIESYGYMGVIKRDQARIKKTSEVFTPMSVVNEMLDQLDPQVFKDPSKTFLDPSCGDGQFLCGVLLRKLECGIEFSVALSTLYGVDLQEDNVMLCRERLLCGMTEYEPVVRRNIVCADALTYDYSFGEVESFFTSY